MLGQPSLRRRIVLPFVVLVVFVGAIGTAVVSAQVGGTTAGEFDNSLVRSSLRANDRMAALENNRLEQLRAAAGTAGVDRAVAHHDREAARRLLSPIVGNAQPEELVLRLIDLSRQSIVALRRSDSSVITLSDGVSYADEPAVTNVLRGDRDALGDKYVFRSTEAGTPMVYWAAPVRTQDEAQMVVGGVLLGESLAAIVDGLRGTPGMYVVIYDLAGHVLATSLNGTTSLSTDVMRQVRHDMPVRVAFERSGHAYRQLVSDWTMRNTTLGYVAVVLNADGLAGSISAVRLVLVVLFAAVALGALLIGMALADRITRPIENLVASMRGVSAGDYSRRATISSKDEIGYLAQTFNEMTAALQTQIREREEAYFRNLEALARAIDARDPYTFEHSARVAAISELLAEELGLPADDLVVLRRSGLLHDIGKIGVPDRILGKATPLTEEEWATIRKHPSMGYDMVKDVPFLRRSLDGIRHHHERWDGEGYPDQLRGNLIPVLARIVATADAFDAMTSERPYRKGFSFQFAAQTIVSESGRQFDPAVVEAFKAKKDAIFARLVEMGKKPTPHASDIRFDERAA